MIKLSTRGRYGTRVLLDLALDQNKKGPVKLKEIAQRQRISLQYLEQNEIDSIAAGFLIEGRTGDTIAQSVILDEKINNYLAIYIK